jgi:hypothetical protein
MVTTWTMDWSTMRCMRAASVDDFPEPAGPVISTSPWGRRVSSWRTSGSPQSSSVGKSNGTLRKVADRVPRW